ncbi:hypothetical protein B0H34DRAFT_473427 [Crassisporium funariophilum]|nr:hypothetical protein B0H34DRAFT_473427 [Crassisporium funariophilum]
MLVLPEGRKHTGPAAADNWPAGLSPAIGTLVSARAQGSEASGNRLPPSVVSIHPGAPQAYSYSQPRVLNVELSESETGKVASDCRRVRLSQTCSTRCDDYLTYTRTKILSLPHFVSSLNVANVGHSQCVILTSTSGSMSNDSPWQPPHI